MFMFMLMRRFILIRGVHIMVLMMIVVIVPVGMRQGFVGVFKNLGIITRPQHCPHRGK